ncbi:MAG: endonuclease/exonuclease/phosphatase family protein [Candidatus Helarchaeota archaeon]
MNLVNKKIIFSALLILPLIFSLIYMGIGLNRPLTTGNDKQIKIMTYNIHFGVGMDDKMDLERLAQNILIEDPDILGLEEVENGRFTSQGVDMALWFATRLGMQYVYYPSVNDAAFGVALLSKYPIIYSATYDLPSLQLERVLIHGRIRINSTFTLDVFVTHLGLNETENVEYQENQTAQVETILSITSSITGPKILMGDFNMLENNSNIQWITKTFNDTWRDFNPLSTQGSFPSYPAPVPGNRIDYIFATNFSSIVDSHIRTDMIPGVYAPWEYGSDHAPVITTLTF